MIRKHIAITADQQRLLRRISKARGLTESELIRQAVARGLGSEFGVSCDMEAWNEARAFIMRRMARSPGADKRRWARDQLYDRKITG